MAVETKFPLISGEVSLDLVNTELVRHGARHDLLTESKHVIEWINTLKRHNVLLDEQFNNNLEEWAVDAVTPLRDIRSLLRREYEKMATEGKPSIGLISYLQSLIKEAPFSYELKGKNLIPIPIGKPVDALVSLIAYNAVSLYATNKLESICQCANPECVLLFIDSNGRRKWCSMKICGNRKKVTRHQQKNKQ
ncbi:CGNR zinc finger domain-containing protein [Planococcus lenghuensis]|uniref:RNA-binding protein n=1 Tax=Planococcus lenghuensis TaxID=2213202 RepID=A0A1Q2L541_9BACL|nr:CGNR zinc finger domain-containing protein [Planococcus lenghuensis]AQQ55536.1 RNA-binding protein [Planococcus lenghuensis]